MLNYRVSYEFLFRDTQDNIMLLREQVESSKIKLERAEKKTAEFTKLQTENEVRFIKSRKIITCYIMVFEEIPK